MAAHDVHAINRFCLRAFECRDDVRDDGGRRHAPARRWLRRLRVRLLLDRHAPARRLRDLLKLTVEPIARRADAALRIILRRERVARAKRDELANGALDVARINLREHARDLRVARHARAGRCPGAGIAASLRVRLTGQGD